MLRSLVREPASNTAALPRRFGPVGALSAGFLLSAVTGFAIVSGLGALARADAIPATALRCVTVALALAAVGLDIRALAGHDICRVGLLRQTPRNIIYRYGPNVGPFLWGLDTGTAFSTVRVSAATWLLFALCLIHQAPWWSGVLYAAGFCLSVGLLTVAPAGRWSAGAQDTAAIMRGLYRVRWMFQLICLLAAAGVGLAALAGR